MNNLFVDKTGLKERTLGEKERIDEAPRVPIKYKGRNMVCQKIDTARFSSLAGAKTIMFTWKCKECLIYPNKTFMNNGRYL